MGSVKELPVPFVLRRDGCNDPAKFVDRIDISAGDSSNNFQKSTNSTLTMYHFNDTIWAT